MLLDRQGRYERRPGELHRFIFEEKLNGLAQVCKRLLNRLSLRRRPRFGIESDVAALLSRRQNGSDLHDKLLSGSLARTLRQRQPHRNASAAVDHDTTGDLARYRLRLGSNRKKLSHNPRLDLAKVVTGLVYGLVNVRTDGRRLLFALREESGKD
jgi:hypothetical protein